MRHFHLNDIAICRTIPEAALAVHRKPAIPETGGEPSGHEYMVPKVLRSIPVRAGRAGVASDPGKPAPQRYRLIPDSPRQCIACSSVEREIIPLIFHNPGIRKKRTTAMRYQQLLPVTLWRFQVQGMLPCSRNPVSCVYR